MKRHIKQTLETFTADEAYYKLHSASVQEVADLFGIKKSTLHDFLKRKHDPENPLGGKPALTKQEEHCLVSWLLWLSSFGHPPARSFVRAILL